MPSVILHQSARDAIVHHVILRRWFFGLKHWETVCGCKLYVNGCCKKDGKAMCAMHSVILDQGASKRCNCASCGEREASVPSGSLFFARATLLPMY